MNIELFYKKTKEPIEDNIYDVYTIRATGLENGKVYVERWNGMGYADPLECKNIDWKIKDEKT